MIFFSLEMAYFGGIGGILKIRGQFALVPPLDILGGLVPLSPVIYAHVRRPTTCTVASPAYRLDAQYWNGVQ